MPSKRDAREDQRRRCERMSRQELRAWQLDRFNRLAADVLRTNPYWRQRLAQVPFPLADLEDLARLPFTTKADLVEAAARSPESLLTQPIAAYTRVHRTSGTTSRPLLVYDTPADWDWWIETWQFVLDAADVKPGERAVMAFSYGPYIGFWSAHDALLHRGVLVMPTGGMSSQARLQCIQDLQATILCCTPTYALRLLEVAQTISLDLGTFPVRVLIVAGEPGGSDPQIRTAIEEGWGATVIDHAGATELGPWGYADCDRRGLHVAESEFIAEFLAPTTDGTPSELSELVLTPLGRRGMPLFRYRTGDLVKPLFADDGSPGNQFVLLEGGIRGRADDMLMIRGVNVFPSAIESTIRGVLPLAEYRMIVDTQGPLSQLNLQVEADAAVAKAIADRLSTVLGLRVEVETVAPGSLPRFDGKARRIVHVP